VAVRTRPDNLRLIEALHKVMNEAK